MDRGAVFRGEIEAVQARAPRLGQEPPAQRGPHRVGLLQDLFEHEVGVAAQLQLRHIPGDVVHRAQLHVRLAVQDRVPGRGEDRDVAVVQVHDGARVLEHGRGVRRHKQLVVADAEQHRRSLARHYDLSRLRR